MGIKSTFKRVERQVSHELGRLRGNETGRVIGQVGGVVGGLVGFGSQGAAITGRPTTGLDRDEFLRLKAEEEGEALNKAKREEAERQRGNRSRQGRGAVLAGRDFNQQARSAGLVNQAVLTRGTLG